MCLPTPRGAGLGWAGTPARASSPGRLTPQGAGVGLEGPSPGWAGSSLGLARASPAPYPSHKYNPKGALLSQPAALMHR